MPDGGLAKRKTPSCSRLAFDPFPFEQDGPAAPEAGVGRCEGAEALVVVVMAVVVDEGVDLCLEIAGQVVVLKQDPVPQRLMPTSILLCTMG